MKTILPICMLLFISLTTARAQAQQEQELAEEVYYEVVGLVYVKEYNVLQHQASQTEKVPSPPLRFKIAGVTVDSNNQSIQIIKFYDIKDESSSKSVTVQGFKNNTTFVNSTDNDEYFWVYKTYLDQCLLAKTIVQKFGIRRGGLTYGASVSLPFKFRPKVEDKNIKITPDITLGGFIGYKRRLSTTKPHYISLIGTLGLATLPVSEDTQSMDTELSGDGLVLGVTGSIGLIFQLDDFQFGIMTGKDRAAGELGKDWIYNNEQWVSFSIGYTFIGNKKKTEN